ncbi:MAG: OmpA family protein, partial [Bacteroidaceae bacterium]|nr:OmpA family protein [Bacteroidaceae bacterium]
VMRKEAGDLYVNFPLNQSELLPDFRDNAAMLEKILAITQMIQDDSRCRLHKIQIIGLASIEGPNRHNEDLSDQRAIALKNYVKQHVRGLSENKFELYGGGEAWAEFRDQINDLLIDTKLQSKHPTLTRLDLQRMMDIIDNEGNLDIREQKLRRINDGETFKYLLSTLLADQRNSGYLRIYYDRVPDSRADIINYALELMTEKEFENACELLQTVKDDSRSWNALGISLYMTGQKEEGIHYITLAAEQGNADAIRNLKQLNSHKE